MKEKNMLWEEDEKLFASMKGKYRSVNEENFFKNIQYKHEYECTALNDLICLCLNTRTLTKYTLSERFMRNML